MRTFVMHLALVVLLLSVHSVAFTKAQTTTPPDQKDVKVKGGLFQMGGLFQFGGLRWLKGTSDDPSAHSEHSVMDGAERALPLTLLLPLLGLSHILCF